MLERGVTVAGPRQTEIITVHVVAGFLIHHILGAAQGLHVERVHIAHVRLEAFW